jgi:hypothetical protein
MDPADRLVCRWLAAIGLALALAVAIGLAVGSFVVAGRHEARIRQELALAWEENGPSPFGSGWPRTSSAALLEPSRRTQRGEPCSVGTPQLEPSLSGASC